MKQRSITSGLGIGLFFLAIFMLHISCTGSSEVNTTHNGSVPTSDLNCTPAGINQFPRIIMNQYVRIHGGVIVHILLALYCCWTLSIVCEEYFVPALATISTVLHIKPDVAGATFMASGTSAPALAATIIALFVTKDDVGVGTIAGSAVFNVAFVVSICGFCAGKVLYLNWWPIFRDNLFYLASIVALIFIIWDEIVDWWESMILLLLYALYIAFMFVNERLEAYFTSLPFLSCLNIKASSSELSLNTSQSNISENGVSAISGVSVTLETFKSDRITIQTSVVGAEPGALTNGKRHSSFGAETSAIGIVPRTVVTKPTSLYSQLGWVLSFPILFVCYLTIPDCRLERWKKLYVVTFLIACVWIGVSSYVLVWMVNIIGFTLGISDSVMGLTFLAAGVSLPDVFASLIVAKQGEGDMALSNAVASNVFNILVCLGLPWFLQGAIASPGSKIPVNSGGMVLTNASLVLTVVFLPVVTYLNKWKMNRLYGALMMLWYLVFMVVLTLYQLNFFGVITEPTCKSNY